MGQDIDQESFSETDRQCFAEQLRSDLAALELLLARPDNGAGLLFFGFVFVFFFVDEAGRLLLRF